MTNRIAFGIATALLSLGIGAGLYASGQNTNQNPPPFMGRGPGGRGGPMGPGGPMGMLPPMLGRELGITDAQQAQIKAIADSHRDEWKALGERARAAHVALDDAVTADTVDEGLVRQRSAEVAAVESDMAVARAHAHYEVFQVLTPDQRAQAKTLRAQAQQRMQQRGAGSQGRGLLF